MPADIFIEIKCDSCGRLISSEVWRSQLAFVFDAWAVWFKGRLQAHELECEGKKGTTV